MTPANGKLLGPFVGAVSADSAKVWLQLQDLAPGMTRSLTVNLHENNQESVASQATLIMDGDGLGAGIVRFDSLKPDTEYYYRLAEAGQPFPLDGLEANDLHFRTLPTDSSHGHLDFLLMSCHNPETSVSDGMNGFAVWSAIPRIMQENNRVRFALLAGDQIYGDDVEKSVLGETDARKRQESYLQIYRKFWGNIHYRRVLCSIPAVLMWDDHDITDGWGSREDSFRDDAPKQFRPEWQRLFETARSVFSRMQAIRNPEPLSANFQSGFDFCFRVGRAGFAVPDLRSNRNVRENRVWLTEQLDAMRDWVQKNREQIDTLFFVSSVVFSHGDPGLESFAVRNWGVVLRFIAWLAGRCKALNPLYQDFDKNVGDLRDDINDSWGAAVNAEQADQVLDWLFALQNPTSGEKPINVVILSGDIHTPGYSTIYSSAPGHQKRAVIPHIVATPVAYKPTSWLLEAVYRHLTKAVKLGVRGVFTAQVSHHYCHRNVVVVSLRHFERETHLKVKYYLEGFPEPEIMLFDLVRGSHREGIEWPGSPQAPRLAPVSV